MSEKKLQIFIGSTFTDLKEERDALTRAILRTGNIPVGMEQFLPSDEESWGVITQYIDTSDGYFLILGHRYGSIHKQKDVGYTELEYDYAKSKGVPVYAMLLARDCKRDADETSRQRELYDSFRTRLTEERNIREWRDRHDLESTAITVIATDKTLQSRPGWHRSRIDAADSLAEITKLSNENRDLRLEVSRIKSASAPIMRSETVAAALRDKYVYTYEQLCAGDGEYIDPTSTTLTLRDLLLSVTSKLLIGCLDYEFSYAIACGFHGPDSTWAGPVSNYWHTTAQDDLGLLGIIDVRHMTVPSFDRQQLETRLFLTEFGKLVVLKLREDHSKEGS